MNFNMGFFFCFEFIIKLLVFNDFIAVGILGFGVDGLEGLSIFIFLDVLFDKEGFEVELLLRSGNKFFDWFIVVDGICCREFEVDCLFVLMDLLRFRVFVILFFFFNCWNLLNEFNVEVLDEFCILFAVGILNFFRLVVMVFK